MTTHQIFVENIKCSGCVNSIRPALLKIKGVTGVEILKEEDKITLTGWAIKREAVLKKLAALGYPEKGSNSLMNKARSFVSCAIGRVLKK